MILNWNERLACATLGPRKRGVASVAGNLAIFLQRRGHRIIFLKEGLSFNPDLVVLMFYENDLTDNLLSYYPGFGPRPYATFDGAVDILTMHKLRVPGLSNED